MRRILLLTSIILAALSTVAMAVEIDPKPLELHQRVGGEPPKDYSDESSFLWVPKGDLGITFKQATKGLEKIIPRVIRWIDPPGFQGESADGKILLRMWGDERAIKRIWLEVPFCVDPYRFSLGSWSDMERPVKILTSCLDSAFPSYNGRENREWIDDFVTNMLHQPLRNLLNDEVITSDGCVAFKLQEPMVRKASETAEITLSSGLTLEVTPPRKKY